MTSTYTFTTTHATVFSRYVQYNYDKIINLIPLDKYAFKPNGFLFSFNNVNCHLIYNYADDCIADENELHSPLVSVQLRLVAIDTTDYFEYLFKNILIWEAGQSVQLSKILEIIQSCAGLVLNICACGDPITNPKMDKCEECFLFTTQQPEPCCVCFENDYRWVKLNCKCKNGRVIHRHCFFRLVQRQCPFCRTPVNHWNAKEWIEDPDFKSMV